MKNNNWYVITGAPCSGKTTVLKALEKKGYRVVYEAARTVIDSEMKQGKTLKQIRNNELTFQKKVLKLKIKREKSLPKDELIFFERGIPDSTAYYELYGVTNDIYLQKAIKNCTYKKVFLFEILDYVKDYARTESVEEARQIQQLLVKSYKHLTKPFITVPRVSVDERTQFVIDEVAIKNSMNFNPDTFQSPFSWRYGSDKMRIIFSEKYKYELWRRVWIALAESQYKAGLVSRKELNDLKKQEKNIDIQRILEIEKETRHDVVSAIHEYAEKAKLGGGKIHLGATSTDITDNTDMIRMQEAISIIEKSLNKNLKLFSKLIKTYARLPCIGYTHLQPAEPTTVGYRLAFYAQDLLTDLELLQFVKKMIACKGMKGAVGTAASYETLLSQTKMSSSKLESLVMKKLGIKSSLISSQVYTRKYDFMVLTLLQSISSSLAKFASDLRILQSANIGEWSEPFGKKQIGSSAMPFKKNPINSENICSLARYVAKLPAIALENATHSYLERTLDDSANRRIIIPESFLAVDQILTTAQKILTGLVINKKRIAFNLAQYGPFAATEAILMEAVKKGADRQKMHETLRKISLNAWDVIQDGKPNPMAELLRENNEVSNYVSKNRLIKLMNVSHHIGTAPNRAMKLTRKIDNFMNA